MLGHLLRQRWRDPWDWRVLTELDPISYGATLAHELRFQVEQIVAHSLLGRLALREGQRDLAARLHRESVALARVAGNQINLADRLANLTWLSDVRCAGGLVALMPELAAVTCAPGDAAGADRELDQLVQQMLADLRLLSVCGIKVQ